MTFGHKYWATLDEPGCWLNYQVNQITHADLHANGMIDVLGRQTLGNQYISLLADDKFPRVAQVYSNSAQPQPPTSIYPGSLFEAAGPNGIGEAASGTPYSEQSPPLCILPWDTTPGMLISESSEITQAGAARYAFPYTCQVMRKGAYGPWADTVTVAYYEVLNKRTLNYVFAAGAPGSVRGLVSFWSVIVKADGTLEPGLEYWAFEAGRV